MGRYLSFALIGLLWATSASAQLSGTVPNAEPAQRPRMETAILTGSATDQLPYTLTLQSNSPITVVSPSPTPTSTPTPVPTPTPITSVMAITAPIDGSVISGSIAVSYAGSADVAWANLYVDGAWHSSSGAGSAGNFLLDTTKLSNSGHTLKVTGFASPSNTALASASISVTVANTVPTPSPSTTPTGTPTPTPSTSPTPTPGPTPIVGAVYFSPAGNDQTGDGSRGNPFATVAKMESMLASAQPGAHFLFQTSSTPWNEMMVFGDVPAHAVHGTVANPIIVSIYGQTQQNPYAILDEQNVKPYCISSLYPTQPVNGLSISGFECKHATTQGIAFRIPGNKVIIDGSKQFQGISIIGNWIHNVGPGCSSMDGLCPGIDQGGYANVVGFEDDQSNPHSVYIAKNKIQNSGGHNCLQIHGDTGAMIEDSNILGPGCTHNMSDLKMVGNSAANPPIVARRTNNFLNCGFSIGHCGPQNAGSDALFSMNVVPTVNEDLLDEGNVAFDIGGTRSGYSGSCINIHPNATPSGCPAGQMCPIVYRMHNNTCRGPRNSATIGVGYMPTTGTGGPSSFDMQNNIIDGFGTSVSVQGLAAGNATENYNNIGGQQGSSGFQFNGVTTPGLHDVKNVDPLYVNAPLGNLNLKAGSPMINAGNNLNNGNTNIGAYAGSGQ